MSLQFCTKIHTQRPHDKSDKRAHRDARQLQRSFESDRGRIINSAAIRRLQQKTQVFPLEKNAAVRSRLTHSMEVQQVGRFIVQTIFDQLSAQQLADYGLAKLDRCIESIVEMSCLMHDIGNPPFGHFGEHAINQWFAENLDTLAINVNPSTQVSVFANDKELAVDLKNFEGNAQAIRLIHTLLNLNLTYSQAASILKYTRPGTMKKADIPIDKRYLMKKVGYYYSETAYVSQLCDSLAIDLGCRHPLSYIMEAADDISYCLADIEDAVEKGLITTDTLSSLLQDTYRQVLNSNNYSLDDNTINTALENMRKTIAAAQKSSSKPQSYFITLRVNLSHPLVKHAAKQFIDNIADIYHGTFDNALLEDNSQYHAITATLKRIAISHVFCHKEVEQLELQGFRIISGLLECYKPLLTLDHETFTKVIKQAKDAPLIAKHLLKKLPEKHLSAYQSAIVNLTADRFASLEFYYRCRLIQDYISGMTDQFAYDEYRMLMVVD